MKANKQRVADEPKTGRPADARHCHPVARLLVALTLVSLMAPGQVQALEATFDDEVLSIRGGEGENVVVGVDGEGNVTVNGEAVTVDGEVIPAAQVNGLIVGGEGDAYIDLVGVKAEDFPLLGGEMAIFPGIWIFDVWILGGAGNDNLHGPKDLPAVIDGGPGDDNIGSYGGGDVIGGPGNDTINIHAPKSRIATSINGGDGVDTVNNNLHSGGKALGAPASVFVEDLGTSGIDTLVVHIWDDSATVVQVSSTTVEVEGRLAEWYSGIEQIEVNLGSADDSVAVVGMGSDSLILNGGDGDDVLDVVAELATQVTHSAFEQVNESYEPQLCVPSQTTLCLDSGRFAVEVTWRDSRDNTGSGQVVRFRADDSGMFWFFDENNWEMLVKVLDACAINQHYWVFAAATTNVEYTLTVTDMVAEQSTSYVNQLGVSSPAITDTQALATCSARR